MTIKDFIGWSRIGRTKTYEEIGGGKLPVIKIGRRTYIRTADAQMWLDDYAKPAVAKEAR
jgi:hypothetical protein